MVIQRLKQFKNPTYVHAQPLEDFVTALFEKAGMPEGGARQSAEVLVAADVMGADSHGVCYSVPGRVHGIASGAINANPNIRITHETPSTAVVDGDRGMGLVVGRRAMEIAIEKAAEVGTGAVAVTNSNHYGMAAFFPMMALEHDMIGITMSTAGLSVVPTFARDAAIGTNPIAVAVPADREPPFILDMATSVVASGKIGIARALGVELPEGWAIDESGEAITDPERLAKRRRGLPLGGTRELGSHKGYGLAVMVDILSGVLSGNGAGSLLPVPRPTGHFFQALRIDAFRPAAEFKQYMDEMLRGLRNLTPGKGHERVYYAGLQEAETGEKRLREGIPLPEHTVESFKSLAEELGVEYTLGG